MHELLEQSLRAYGGLSRWKELHAVEARLSIAGDLFTVKGYPEGIRDIDVRVNTRQPETEIRQYRALGTRDIFRPERVCSENAAGVIVLSLDAPRKSFAGHTRETPWNAMQRLYFTGYALWNYLTTPFLLTWPGFEFEELGGHDEGGEQWRPLLARFPKTIPTHSKEQVFYFDESGLVRRHDYMIDVAVGAASRYPLDHMPFHGILFATRHRVVPRTATGPKLAGPSAVFLDIVDVFVK